MRLNKSFEAISEDFRNLGVEKGDTLLVHSSMRSLGPVEGGAQTVVEALLQVLGDQGTLLMPALSFATVTASAPCFSAAETPCCTGALPEFFRGFPGTVRSMHPTHSVCAFGSMAEEMTENHRLDNTPVGQNSPFRLLPKVGGKILMLGCGLRPNTSMHGVEELVVPPYLFRKEKTVFTLTDIDGKKTQRAYICHNFEGYRQRYDRVSSVLVGQELREGMVRKVNCYLIDATALWQKAQAELRQNPFFFVEKG